MVLGRVAEIWRYPLSGLQDEKLTQAEVLETGIAGDHIYVLRSKEWDKILDLISHSSSLRETAGLQNMLEFAATLSGDPMGEHDVTIGRLVGLSIRVRILAT